MCAEVGSIMNNEKLDALLCFAGGWAGGSPGSKDFIKVRFIRWSFLGIHLLKKKMHIS